MAQAAAILLAGGESIRMGTPKPLLEWGGQTLVEYQIAQLAQVPASPIVVVLGHRAHEVLPYVHRAGARAIVNELYAEGRASSVRVGAAALPDATPAIIILNVDQPRPAWVTKLLVDEHFRRRSLITVPVHEGERGHPLIVSGSLLPELRQVQEATQGLRAVLQRHEHGIAEITFRSAVVLLDMNRPEEYEKAKASYFEQVKP